MKKKLISLCCVLLALLLCTPAAFAEAEPTPVPELDEAAIRAILSEAYTMREYDGEKLHFFELRRRDLPLNSPILIMLHGTGGRKEELAGIAKGFIDAGYVVVIPDLPGHGESVSDEPLNMFDIIQRAAENIDIILSMYENMMYADADRFAILGNSLGGFTAMYYAAYSETKPQCVVSYSATPDWSKVLDSGLFYTYRRNGTRVLMATKEERERLTTEITENAPDQNMEELLSVPLLLVNSDVDDLVSIDWIRDFEERAEEYPNRLTVVVKEGYAHGIIDPAATEAVAFLQEYMPPVQTEG